MFFNTACADIISDGEGGRLDRKSVYFTGGQVNFVTFHLVYFTSILSVCYN